MCGPSGSNLEPNLFAIVGCNQFHLREWTLLYRQPLVPCDTDWLAVKILPLNTNWQKDSSIRCQFISANIFQQVLGLGASGANVSFSHTTIMLSLCTFNSGDFPIAARLDSHFGDAGMEDCSSRASLNRGHRYAWAVCPSRGSEKVEASGEESKHVEARSEGPDSNMMSAKE